MKPLPWSNTDWKQTNECIARQRKRVKPCDLPWHTVDWSQPNTVLAAQLGCAHSTVLRYRAIHAPGSGIRRGKYDWGKVKDWNQRTDVLARIVGCSEGRVTLYRHEQGIKLGPRKPGSGLWKRKQSKL